MKEGYLTGPEPAMDFPVINNSIMGMKNKYGYTQGLDTIASSNAAKYIVHENVLQRSLTSPNYQSSSFMECRDAYV